MGPGKAHNSPADQHASEAKSTGRSKEFTRAALFAMVGAWFGFLFGPNAMVSATNSNFLNVLPDALGVSRTAVSGVLATSVWIVAVCVPIAGRQMDRYGIRRIILTGIILFGCAFLALSQVKVLWHFAVLQVLLAIPVAMNSSVGYAKLISLWFDRNRGVVLGLCVAFGAGLGQAIMPKLSQYFIQNFGWSGGYMAIGLMILLIGFPVIFLLARPPKSVESVAAATSADSASETYGVTRAEALREPVFYLVFVAIMFASMSLIGTMVQSVPMLTDRGVPVDMATTVLSLAFVGVMIGEFSAGFVVDRINSPKIVLPYFITALIGLMIIHSAGSSSILYVGAVMLGMGFGCEVGLNAYMISRYFGLKAFGSIYGLTFAASNLGIGCGIFIFGLMRDLTGSYEIMRYIIGGTMVTSIICIALLPKFRYAPRKH
ncbi:MAG: MFS transporter [Parvularculaceae bacterium]